MNEPIYLNDLLRLEKTVLKRTKIKFNQFNGESNPTNNSESKAANKN